ncbi:type II toxin-antitoxin system PemK/MazF family toxin [Gryllotalpicola protaetiae]|uniref:Type II toxin-antitoxin system PemK/MazF family toxin n=1 Tax=Gryllotalpicola protaetiae TaxID=2419771 RepID=A0A387BV59_9MICO|nr:type II toxin-antitoxin system PemK/MazF family toxin [Gryllotalpicola protaetiae]AYG04839.1 type II toxin-antitoxin system PemK/MazF family toxin [Gryllotalpicola protaetiae]
MRRGELWTVSGDVYASKPRPALILQDDRFDATESVTVAPLTTTAVDAPLLRYRLDPAGGNGLDATSFIMVDKLTTVRRNNIGKQFGSLTGSQLIEVERLVIVFLGLAG